MKNKLIILKAEKGATFVEIMLAVAILAIIAVPLLNSVLASVNNNTVAKQKTEAIAMAERVMEEVKAQSAISEKGSPTIYASMGSGDLVPYHSVLLEKNGEVNADTAYSTNTIDIKEEAKGADFEFVITQGDDRTDNMVNLSIKNYYGTVIYNNDVSITDSLTLEVDQINKCYTISNSTDSNSTEEIATGEIKNTNKMKMKVSYTDATPSSAEQLKIETYVTPDDSIANNNIFTVYVIENDEANSGVSFIGRRNSQFLVKYMNSAGYGTINSLYKITVYIVKKSAAISSVLDVSKVEKSDIVYETSSYVKK